MRSRSFFIVAALVVLLLVAAGGVYAYDSGREHQIAKGITVGGVDVGGLEAGGRRAASALGGARAAQPGRWSPRYHGKRYTLTPEQARVGVDIDGSINQAMRPLALGQDLRAHRAQPARQA